MGTVNAFGQDVCQSNRNPQITKKRKEKKMVNGTDGYKINWATKELNL